jgi:hypothetical protein
MGPQPSWPRAGAHLAQRATGELKVLAGVALVARDEEHFLLEADVAHITLDVKVHEAKELLALVRHCGGGTRKRDLLVQDLAGVGYKRGWDKDGVAAKENGRHGIGREVCPWGRSGSVRRAHAAVRVRRAVRLAVEKILALELPDGGHVVVKLEERRLDLRGLPVPERRSHRLFAPNEDLIWLRCGSVNARMASGYGTRGGGWGLALTTYRRSAAERGAGEGGGGGGGSIKFVIENEDQDCKQFALYRNDFRMHLALTAS